LSSLTIFCFIVAFAGGLNADLTNLKLDDACSFVSGIGLSTKGWKDYGDDYWGCTSYPKLIGNSGPSWAPGLKNNLTFYVSGTETHVQRLKLLLNVNNASEAGAAHGEMLKAAKVLSKKALGEELPKAIQSAIKTGQDASIKVGSKEIELIREVWKTGKGYNMQLNIK